MSMRADLFGCEQKKKGIGIQLGDCRVKNWLELMNLNQQNVNLGMIRAINTTKKVTCPFKLQLKEMLWRSTPVSIRYWAVCFYILVNGYKHMMDFLS